MLLKSLLPGASRQTAEADLPRTSLWTTTVTSEWDRCLWGRGRPRFAVNRVCSR